MENKIHPNIVAATILGVSIIIASIIIYNMPMPGRYTEYSTEDKGGMSWSYTLFDSATGTKYTNFYAPTSGIVDCWEQISLDDVLTKIKQSLPLEKQVEAHMRDKKLAEEYEKRLDERKSKNTRSSDK